MKIKRLISTILVLSAILSCTAIFSASDGDYLPYCMSLTVGSDETERGFSWYYVEGGTGSFTYTEADKLVDGKMPDDAITLTAEGVFVNDDEEHSYQVTLTDLKPNTEYVYQVTNDGNSTDIIPFKTGETDDFSFVLLGDVQVDHTHREEYDLWENSLQTIIGSEKLNDFSFFVSIGDQVDYGVDELDYRFFLNHDALYGITLAPTLGNHDRDWHAFKMHFNLPNKSDKYGLNAAGSDFYFTYNDVLFMSLNTNCTATDEHRAFMEETIAANPDAKWKIVLMHHGIFGASEHIYEDNVLTHKEELVPVLDELGIDVVLNGHDHTYCRTYIMDGTTPITDPEKYDNPEMTSVTDPEGILYITANSASGTQMYEPLGYDRIPYAAYAHQDMVPYAARVYVSDTEFTITTYRLDNLDVVDTFTINKSLELPFTDVEEGKWYTEGIRYCYANELMAGVSDTEFGRKQNVNRAMFATVLAKIDGGEIPEYTADEMTFSDVEAGKWYSNAIEWAYRNEYAAGMGEGIFGRKNDVSREQIAMFLYTYAEKNGVDVSDRADITGYDDYSRIHEYAQNALSWAVAKELISGTGETTLAPRSSASRAEIALIVKNFVENIK